MFDSLSFKTSTNFKKCLNHEMTNFSDIYQDFRLGGFKFHRAIDWRRYYLNFGTSLEIVGLLCSYYTLGHSNIWLCGSLFVIPLFGHFRGAKKGTNSNFTNNRCQNLINYFWYLTNRKSIIVKFIYGYIHWFVTLK